MKDNCYNLNMKVIKGFLKGLLYVILSPFILVGFAVYTVYSLLLFIVEFLNASLHFFSGKKLTTDLKEDKKVRQLIVEKDKKMKEDEERQRKIDERLSEQTASQQGPTTINNFYITQDQLPIDGLNNIQGIKHEDPKEIENKKYLEIEDNKGGKDNE